MNDTVTIAVIGNASAGKTSFLRSLTRDLSFGEVGFLPTTNSKKEIVDSNITFVDTPGFQCAELVREWVDEEFKKLERPSPEKVINLISKHQDRTNLQLQNGVFKHDMIAWKALIDADAILFLVDISQDPNIDGNLESSCLLLPESPGTQIIFNFLPTDKSKLEKCREHWNVMKNDWGIRGASIDYDAFHRDYEAEIKVLRGVMSKLIDSSKVDLMDRYIKKRIGEEKNRLLASFKMAISLINRLAEISCYIEDLLKHSTDKDNKTAIYNRIKPDLQTKIERLLFAFCNSILYIWGFQTPENSDNYGLLPELAKGNPNKYPMSKLVQLNTSSVSDVLSKYNAENFVWWRSHLTNFLPSTISILLPRRRGFDTSLPIPSILYKKICGGISLKSHTDLLGSFIPCALDFIKKVRERGIAMPTSLYKFNREDEECHVPNKITFIMPSEPEFTSIDAGFKKFKWKSKIVAKEEWIPKLLELFGMPQDS